MAISNLVGGAVGGAADSGLLGAAQAQGEKLFAQQVGFGMQQADKEAKQTMANEVLKVTMNAADISAK